MNPAHWLSGFLILVCLSVALPARAAEGQDIIEGVRCIRDTLPASLVEGRRQWLVKCGYITQKKSDGLAAVGIFPSIAQFIAPFDIHAPCRYDGKIAAYCEDLGCYTPSQRVLFGGVYRTLESAALNGIRTLTTAGNSLVPQVEADTKEVAIEKYLSGDEVGSIYEISVDGNLSIEVTDTHPMVAADGTVMRADAVRGGYTCLLTTLGPKRVSAVRKVPYVGKVKNVQPVSHAVSDNILIAEGFVVGSLRFQNEWADDETKIQLRESVE